MAIGRYIIFLIIGVLIFAFIFKWILVVLQKLKNKEGKAFEKFENKMLNNSKGGKDKMCTENEQASEEAPAEEKPSEEAEEEKDAEVTEEDSKDSE